MLYKIHSHAQIQALQARSDQQGRSMFVRLVSLESVRIAPESYALLRPLTMGSFPWVCPELDLLSAVAGLSLEIQKLEHDLLPQLKVQEAKLEQGTLEALLLMKNSAITLLHLRKSFKEALGVLLYEEDLVSPEEDLVSPKVESLSIVLKDTAYRVLECNCDIFWLRQRRLPCLVQLVNDVLETQARVLWLVQLVTDVLETPVRFSDSDE